MSLGMLRPITFPYPCKNSTTARQCAKAVPESTTPGIRDSSGRGYWKQSSKVTKHQFLHQNLKKKTFSKKGVKLKLTLWSVRHISSVGFFSSSAINCCLFRSSIRRWACALRSAALLAARTAWAAASASAWALARALALLRAPSTLLPWATLSVSVCWTGGVGSTLIDLLRPRFLGSAADSDAGCEACGADGSVGSAFASRCWASCSS